MGIPISKQRAAVFIDGGNFYHTVSDNLGIDVNHLDYAAFVRKLAGNRPLSQIRYYAGRIVNTEGSRKLYAAQRALLARLEKQGVRVRLGRIEKRAHGDQTAAMLRKWLDKNRTKRPRFSESARKELEKICASSRIVWIEKGVDMMCGADMIDMAFRDEYDVAYLVSGDGDFAPAVKMVRERNKRVFVCSAADAYRLARSADVFIPLTRKNFDGCLLSHSLSQNAAPSLRGA